MAKERRDLYSAIDRRPPNQGAKNLVEKYTGGETIAVTGSVATLTENVAALWNGSPQVPQAAKDQLLPLLHNIGELTAVSTLENPLRDLLQLGLSEKVRSGQSTDLVQPVYPPAQRLFELIDASLGSPMMRDAFQLLKPRPAGLPEDVDPRILYLMRAAQAVGQEILVPSLKFEPGHLHPDVRLFSDGIMDLQFDAIVTHEPSEPISDSEHLRNYLLGVSADYDVIQIKLITYDRYDERGWLTTIIPSFHRDLRNQLAAAILDFTGRHEYFTMPQSVFFVYLRPTAGTVIHELRIDSSYLRTWSLQIDFLLQRMKNAHAGDEEIRNHEIVKAFLEEEAAAREVYDRLPAEERDILVDDWRAVAMGYHQVTLFELPPVDVRLQRPQIHVVHRSRSEFSQGPLF